MFMFLNQFFAVQSQSSFWLLAIYEITPTENRYLSREMMNSVVIIEECKLVFWTNVNEESASS